MSRLDQLQKLLEKTPADSFLLYGIAMEHKKAHDYAQAIEFFDRTIVVDAQYCYAYYHKGRTLEEMKDLPGARKTYAQGLDAAARAGDQHAISELQAALDMLEGM